MGTPAPGNGCYERRGGDPKTDLRKEELSKQLGREGRGPKDPGVEARDTGGRSGLLAVLMDNAFCESQPTHPPLVHLTVVQHVSLHLAGRRRIYLQRAAVPIGADAVFSFVSEHQTIGEFWRTAFVTFALRTASLDGSTAVDVFHLHHHHFGPH